MGSPTADALLATIEDVTEGENRAIAAAEPGLAWQLPVLDDIAARMRPLLGNLGAEDATKQIRERLAAIDAVHDDGHRFVLAILTAFESRGTASDRAAVSAARDGLYPRGLAAIRVSYREQVEQRHGYANKLAEPRIKAGVDVVTAAVPEVAAAIAEIDDALGQMKAALTELNQVESASATAPKTRELFDIRREAESALSNFARNVAFVFRGAEGERAAKGDQLTRRWRQAIVDAQRPGDQGTEQTVSPLDLAPPA